MRDVRTRSRWIRTTTALLATAAAALLAGPAAAQAEEPSISGTVTATVAKGGGPIEGAQACAYNFKASKLGCDQTDGLGEYTIDELEFVHAPLEPGEYTVTFQPPLNSNYLLQVYEEPVKVETGPVTGIDAVLLEGGIVEGTVLDAATGTPIAGAEVCVNVNQCAKTGFDGSYAVEGLEPDEFARVQFSAVDYLTQYWHGKLSAGEADPLVVEPENTQSGIDAALSKPAAEEEAPPTQSEPPSLFPSSSLPTTTTTPPRRKRCKKGFRRKKVRGHYRCVRRHRRHHRRSTQRAG